MARATKSLPSILQDGDKRQSLEAIRDRLASELQDARGRDVAPIAKELRSVIAELEQLPGGKEVSPVDQLATRRKARLAKASGM